MLTDNRLTRMMIIASLLALGIATGCQVADLRPDALQDVEPSPLQRDKARHIYTTALASLGGYDRYERIQMKQLTGTDIWYSVWVRWLTPVTETRQAFEVHLRSNPEEIQYLFLNGKRQGDIIGIDRMGTFEAVQGQRRYEDSSSIQLYLQPLRDYFEWPFILLKSPILLYAGSRSINERTYDMVFATRGGAAPSKEHDQFLLYIDRRTGRIDYIEFTLRELMQSYRGALHYMDYRKVEGLWVPFNIGVGDTVEDREYAHVFKFDDIQLK